jgi:hypothetical protein
MDAGVSSADVWIASKLAEVAERCGLSPLDADICFGYHDNPNGVGGFYVMSAVDISSTSQEHIQKTEKLWSLLGLDEFGNRQFVRLSEVGETIERALDIAPRARAR